MAASDVQIANLAGQILGAPRINLLTEDTLVAREMNLAFGSVRDAEFNRRRWRFTFKRVSLPALSAAPDSDYDRQFQLPGDFIRLIEGGDIAACADLTDYRGGNGAALYQIEGRRLLTNLAAPLAIRYIARITDTTLYAPAFDMAFAAKLAYHTCEKITQSTQKQAMCRQIYREAIHDAALASAIEAAPEPIADDSWVMARAQ